MLHEGKLGKCADMNILKIIRVNGNIYLMMSILFLKKNIVTAVQIMGTIIIFT